MSDIFQVVHKQTTTDFCGILPTLDHHISELFQVVQTQSTTAYCGILYLHWTATFEISSSETTIADCTVKSYPLLL